MKNNIIFIFSLPRSGSTLLQKLLATHTQIGTFAEPWILLPLVGMNKDLGTQANYEHWLSTRALNEIIKNMDGGEGSYRDLLNEFVSSLYGSLSKKKYFLDKTPRYYLIIEEIKLIFPEAKIIFLTRNLVSTYISFMNTWYYGGQIKKREHHFDIHTGPELLYNGYLKHKNSSIHIKYEDLVKNPETQLENISDYLGLSNKFSTNVSQRNFKGRMGDKLGEKKFNGVSNSSLKTKNDKFRSLFLKIYINNYLSNYSHELLSFFSTDKVEKKVNRLGVLHLLDFIISVFLRKSNLWKHLIKLKKHLNEA